MSKIIVPAFDTADKDFLTKTRFFAFIDIKRHPEVL